MKSEDDAKKILEEVYGIVKGIDVIEAFGIRSKSNADELLNLLISAFSERSFNKDTDAKEIEELYESTASAYKDKLLSHHLNTERGDLVYGTTENIDSALKTISGCDSDYDDSYASKINWYNVAVQEGIENAQSNFDWLFSSDESREVAQWSHFYHDQSVIAGNYKRVSLLQQTRYNDFIFNLSQSKYTPIRALLEEDTSPKLSREHGRSVLEKRKCYAVRLGCKFGIHFVTKIAEGKIHYLLDGIDLSKVINKEPLKTGGSLPIITSELRFLCKHWEQYKNSVIFYNEGKLVDAPWVKEPELWVDITSKQSRQETSSTIKKTVFLSVAALAITDKSCFGDDRTVSDNPSPEFGVYYSSHAPAQTPPLRGPGRY